MGKIIDLIKTNQISLGEFEYKINQSVTKDFVELLEIKTLGIENYEETEKQICAIGIYIMESLGKYIIDTNDAQRRMNNNKRIVQETEYKILTKVENGITSDDELAFRYISIIHQMVYRDDKNIKINYTPVELVAAISDPESRGIPILIRFKYREDGNQTLEKANKLQVSKAGGSNFNK
ncbi:MAG: hypothetical protein EWM50_05135 [Gottschalkiaceae bacterium]|nr:MAG: hypothetical protein EWM50_05135 [Gottschalkiaceae bacterium]